MIIHAKSAKSNENIGFFFLAYLSGGTAKKTEKLL
jgi:hypothetical protein